MKKCLFCANSFKPTHGNQQYCSTNCKNYKKAASQQKLYGILKDFRKGFLRNYKLFEELVSKPGSKIFSLYQLNKGGFESNCYYGTFINDKKETLYRIGEYFFQIFFENQIHSIKIIKN